MKDPLESRVALLERQQKGMRDELDHYGSMTRNLLDTIKEAFRPDPDDMPRPSEREG
jgi:hypothetical protein